MKTLADRIDAAPRPRFRQSRWIWTLGTIVAVIVLKMLFEQTPWGQYLEDRAYELLLGSFTARGTTTRPDVLVIDISSIQPKSWERAGRRGIATPREPIRDLIDVLTDPHVTDPDRKVKAVGVDIDFSPDNGELIHPDDLTFFEWCLIRTKQTTTPIVLGVKRTARRPDEAWLADDHYMRLAGYIGVPAEPPPVPTSIPTRTSNAPPGTARHGHHWPDRAIYWIWASNGLPLRSMSAALAGIRLDQLIAGEKKHHFWRWAAQPTSITNFAPLQRIHDDVIHYSGNPGAFRGEHKEQIENRIVLLGDTRPEDCVPGKDKDCFNVTGVSKPIHGVFLHACAAMTIMADEPIYELTLSGRIAIDAALALFILVAVKSSIWLRSRLRFPVGRFEHLLKDYIFTLLVIVLVVVFARYLVGRTKLLWTDFILVCIILAFQLVVDTITELRKPIAS